MLIIIDQKNSNRPVLNLPFDEKIRELVQRFSVSNSASINDVLPFQTAFRKFWSEKILNDEVTELRELEDLDPIIRILDSEGKRKYDYDELLKQTLRERLLASGRQYGLTYEIEDLNNRRKLMIKTPGFAKCLVTQPQWYRIFQDVKSDPESKFKLNEIFHTSDDGNRIALIDQLRQINENRENQLIQKQAVALNSLLFAYNVELHTSVFSLRQRSEMIDAFDLGDYDEEASYGTRIINSNSLILDIPRKYGFEMDPWALKVFLYSPEVKQIWGSAKLPRPVLPISPLSPPPAPPAQLGAEALSPDDLRNLVDALTRQKQIILYGPPGTGKTYTAEQVSRAFVSSRNGTNNAEPYIRKTQFHPSYSYENFIEGLTANATSDGRGIYYEIRNGVFKDLCEEARQDRNKERVFVMIIDEVNRGNIPRIFGELLYGMEKRGQPITLAYSHNSNFYVPNNIYIIGTMNTADKSIALIDIALRRRFAFIEMMPDPEMVEDIPSLGFSLQALLTALNARILKRGYNRERQIGHTYFMGINNLRDFKMIWYYQIIPLLQEYFYGDYNTLEGIIGPRFVRVDTQEIIGDLSDEELVEAVQELYQRTD